MAIPHPREIQVAVVNWLDERYPFTKAVDEALYQRVPNFANAFYYCFGGMVFILIVFQLLTGILLALYYVPDASGNPAPAYTSVNFIQNSVYLGWLIRGVHFWGANLLIIMVLLHMARVYWTGAYRAPRELNWIVGVTMLFLILALALTGYLLPWDTKAYFATEVTIKITAGVPIAPVATLIKELLQGGPVVGPPTLQRFFTLHVFVLPALIVLFMYVHFRFIRAHGIAEGLTTSSTPSWSDWPSSPSSWATQGTTWRTTCRMRTRTRSSPTISGPTRSSRSSCSSRSACCLPMCRRIFSSSRPPTPARSPSRDLTGTSCSCSSS
ncbi:MAG: hypothetical protein E6I42_04420 [Chloroflexi bacterium]|nr:MAG: hypothetical protein E6I42_04420 [Chloroflexota bacterium]